VAQRSVAQRVRAECVASAWPERRRLWWLLWSRCPGVGWVRIRALESTFVSLEAAWSAPPDAFAALVGWSPQMLERLSAFRAGWGTDPLPRLVRDVRGGRGVLLPGDPRWPTGVRALARPPLALYWRGRGSLWRPLQGRAAVAVVGTRHPSSHGLTMARSLGSALAQGGWPVVSGLAEGIDAAAHRGCIAAGGAPVGVLGTHLERVYPRHHVELQQKVGRCGLLVTESPVGSPVRAGHFAARNRLQVALATAVVVVECPESSGALHSAELAWAEGLPLWVVPADVGRASAAGSNRLLARGATPLLSPADLLRQLGAGPLAAASPVAAPAGPSAASLPAASTILLKAVGQGASLDALCRQLDRPASELAAQLLELELAGMLRAGPGLSWWPR